MRALKTNAIITGIRSKVDRSLGLTISTPELSTHEKSMFLELQGLNVNLLIEPIEGSDELHKVDNNFEGKTPSQRLRSVLFVLWSQTSKDVDFEIYYKQQVEKVIDHIKSKLD